MGLRQRVDTSRDGKSPFFNVHHQKWYISFYFYVPLSKAILNDLSVYENIQKIAVFWRTAQP